jgi:hypothetical protein
MPADILCMLSAGSCTDPASPCVFPAGLAAFLQAPARRCRFSCWHTAGQGYWCSSIFGAPARNLQAGRRYAAFVGGECIVPSCALVWAHRQITVSCIFVFSTLRRECRSRAVEGCSAEALARQTWWSRTAVWNQGVHAFRCLLVLQPLLQQVCLGCCKDASTVVLVSGGLASYFS